jgi:2',3'-cyclic-nucleotide 2'-phosphodiesterase (5'-nucleotidase family)
LACYIFQDHIEYQITMNSSNSKQVCAQAQRLLWLGVLIAVSSFAALAQTAAKPQTTPTPTAGANVSVHADETLIDSSIPDDPAFAPMLAAYSPKVHEIEKVIGKLKGGDLRKGGVGAGSLGNFVTDGILFEARQKVGNSVVMAVTNAGGLRKNAISEGELRERDIWELLPFENALVQFDLTGTQLMTLLRQVVSHRDAQAGARIKYVNDADNKPQLQSVKLLINGKEQDVDPNATYRVICIDYLMKRTANLPSDTEGNYSVLNQAKKIEPLGLTIRDAIIDYVRQETKAGRDIKVNLDGRFQMDKSGGAKQPEVQP